MNISNGVFGCAKGLNLEKQSNADKAIERYMASYRAASQTTDTVEISAEAYRLADEERMSAVSGRDRLGITKGDKENSFLIHFSDSAMVSRAVSRGYITVNGTDIQLSDEVKKKLLEVDRQAQAEREKAENQYIAEYNLAVARQQAGVLAGAYKDMAEAVQIAAKIGSGRSVSDSDIKKLIRANPELFAMAMAARIMAEKSEKQERAALDKQEEAEQTDSSPGVDWSDFEWKSYETQLQVTMDAQPTVEGVEKAEIILN